MSLAACASPLRPHPGAAPQAGRCICRTAVAEAAAAGLPCLLARGTVRMLRELMFVLIILFIITVLHRRRSVTKQLHSLRMAQQQHGSMAVTQECRRVGDQSIQTSILWIVPRLYCWRLSEILKVLLRVPRKLGQPVLARTLHPTADICSE